MRLMVWHMRMLTRYAGRISRPIVQWYADREVIACGLRAYSSKKVTLIYTPFENRQQHFFYIKKNNLFATADTKKAENFAGDIVHQVQIINSSVGDVCVIKAEHSTRQGTRVVSSPKIYIKKDTIKIDHTVKVQNLERGRASFNWQDAECWKPMIYFLTIVNEKGDCLIGIYTRENHWMYPEVLKASLAVGSKSPVPFEEDRQYMVKLLLVDYDGWVSHMGEKQFTYKDPQGMWLSKQRRKA